MVTMRVLHRLLGLLVLGAALLLVVAPAARPGDRGASPPGVPRLHVGPPPCGTGGHGCVDLYLQNTGFHQEPELLPSVDYRIHLPVEARSPVASRSAAVTTCRSSGVRST